MSRAKYSDELGECKIGDIIQGAIFRDKLVIKSITYDKYVFANLYHCKYIEGRHEGENEDIYEFYNYIKVT